MSDAKPFSLTERVTVTMRGCYGSTKDELWHRANIFRYEATVKKLEARVVDLETVAHELDNCYCEWDGPYVKVECGTCAGRDDYERPRT
jgi:hypothetical protein